MYIINPQATTKTILNKSTNPKAKHESNMKTQNSQSKRRQYKRKTEHRTR